MDRTRFGLGGRLNLAHGWGALRDGVVASWPVGLALLSVAALFAVSMGSMVSIWSESATYGHGFLIPAIAAYMAWVRRDSLTTVPRGFSLIGLPVALAGALAWYIGHVADANVAIHVAMVVFIHAAVLLTAGWPTYRILAFPLAYLFLGVPFGEFAVPPLQDLTADWTVVLIDWTGIPVYQEGWLIHIPGGAFRVAEVCAGLRYVLAAIALSLLVADVFLHRPWHYVAMALVAGLAVPVVANVFRAYGIIILAYVSDFEVAVGVDHLIYGWVFFSLISAIIVLVGLWAGRRTATARTGAPSPAQTPVAANPERAGRGRGSVAGLVVLIGVALGVQGIAGYRISALAAADTPATLPAPTLPQGWRAVPVQTSWSPEFAEPGVTGAWTWQRADGPPVRMDIALWARERPGREAVSARNRIAGSLDQVARGQIRGAGGDEGGPMRLDRLRGSTNDRLVAWTYWVDGRLVASPLEAKVWQAKVRLLGGSHLAGIVAISTDVRSDTETGEARLAAFFDAADLGQYLRKLATANDG